MQLIERMKLKMALIFTAIFAALYYLINFSGIGGAGLLTITGGPHILDLEFGYSVTKAHDMLTALGAEGRAYYLGKIVPIDFPFPVSYMLFFAGWTALLLKHTGLKNATKYLLLVPVLAMLCDFVENIGIIVMQKNYPVLPGWAVGMSSISGIFKSILIVCNIAVVLILAVAWMIKKRRKT
jgi:hypothetical protein